ncbi:MAG: DNA polymerase III subunit delta [Endomicrobium sp.]|jgi:DNA polymerase-3 subunit delta|nr:DNA polymerase III subunit delta [Endomicrobium sp.]
MAILKIADFNKIISSQKIAPVYLFAGEETYLVDACLKSVEKIVNADSLNREIFYASESSAQDILNALQTLPFLGEERLIIVKGANKMKASDAEQLSDYLLNITDTSILVLLYNDNYKKETIAKRKELINNCLSLKDCVSVDCRKLYENEVKEFIKKEFNFRKKSISYDTILKILDNNGTDLLSITSEIEKICLFIGESKKEVNQEDLDLISGYTKELNIYSLSFCIESKDLKKALFILDKLLSRGEEPVMVLSAIYSSIRKMLNAKSMLEERSMSVSQAALNLKIHSFYSSAFFANLKKHDIDKLKETLKKILEADIAIKTGTLDTSFALEKTVIICAHNQRNLEGEKI